jgi:hypothetical protein
MAHELHIRIEDDALDGRYLYVTDASEYDPLLAVSNRYLIAQGPGFDIPVELIFTQGGINAYSAVQFGYATRKNKPVLADGLYTFTYSVAPNKEVLTLVQYYRTFNLQQTLNAQISKRILADKNEVDFSGETAIYEQDRMLMRALYMLGGLNVPLLNDGDFRAATDMYNEVVAILQFLGLKSVERV